MSLLPEYIIQHVLVAGLQRFRENRKLLDPVLRTLRQEDVQRVWEFMRDRSIDISINYPEDGIKIPSICILLRSEFDSQGFLGDMMQPPQRADESPFYAGTPSTGSVTPVTQTAPRVLRSAVTATGGTTTTITASSADFPQYDPFEEAAWVVLLTGTGAGQRRQLVSCSPIPGGTTILTVTPAFTTAPSFDTTFRIDGQATAVVGEPPKVFVDTDVVERLGSHFQTQYQLMLHTAEPDFLVCLYAIVKSIFYLYAHFLIQQGFLNLKMSGTDYLPRSEALPDRAYQRSLMLEFNYSFDVFRAASFGPEPPAWILPSAINTGIVVHDPDTQDPNDPERVALETEITLP